MSEKTTIERTDATWTPLPDATRCPGGCQNNCYAASVAHRFAGTPAYPSGQTWSEYPKENR